MPKQLRIDKLQTIRFVYNIIQYTILRSAFYNRRILTVNTHRTFVRNSNECLAIRTGQFIIIIVIMFNGIYERLAAGTVMFSSQTSTDLSKK